MSVLPPIAGATPGTRRPSFQHATYPRHMSWRKTKIVRQRATGRSVTVLGDTYVGLRLPSGLLDIIDTYAAANGLRRSEAIRALIDEGIIATFPHVKIAEVLSGAKIVRRRKS